MESVLNLKFNFEATGIGSVPFQDAKPACRAIFDNFREIPFWPQLPKRSFLENMYVQFSEHIPGLVLDANNKTVHIDTSKVVSSIEEVYGKYVENDIDFFAISKEYASGFYEFLECIKSPPSGMKFVKGHITGPISYALSLTDQNKKAIIYDKDLFEVLTKILVMRSRWQIRMLKKYFPNIIIFIDEPYLVSIGSSFVNINIEGAFEKLDELAKAIKAEGSLVGVHCCGNTDFSLLLKREIDILNFDAYNFTKELLLYVKEFKSFINRGGTIAWGIVPSSEIMENQVPKALAEKLKAVFSLLAGKGIDKNALSSLITPSCGLGTLDEAMAKKIMVSVKTLSEEFER